MASNLSSEGLKKFRRWYAQYQATSGRPPSNEMQQNFLKAELEAGIARQQQGRALDLQQQSMNQSVDQYNRSLALQREQMEKQARADMITGITNLGMTGIMGAPYLKSGYNSLKDMAKSGYDSAKGMFGGQSQAQSTAGAQAGPQAQPGDYQFGSGGISGEVAAAGRLLPYGPASSAGTYQFGAGGIGAEIDAARGLLPASGGGAASTGTAGAAGAAGGASSSAGSVMGGVTAAGAYYTASKVGGALARANAPEGSFVHDIGRSLDRPLNVEQFWAKEMGAPGWVQDTLDVLNPLGAVEETISNAVGSVICSELYRQGLMDEETYVADIEFGSTLDPDIIIGYHVWAIPVAAAMRESRIVTLLIKWPALAWANHMAGKKSASGYVLLHVGAPICKAIGVLARLMRRQRQSEV